MVIDSTARSKIRDTEDDIIKLKTKIELLEKRLTSVRSFISLIIPYFYEFEEIENDNDELNKIHLSMTNYGLINSQLSEKRNEIIKKVISGLKNKLA